MMNTAFSACHDITDKTKPRIPAWKTEHDAGTVSAKVPCPTP
ncbi:hypothetical protein [Komagataeibacter xylinus]|nr:hypothetical protein [Komagataeibacter xylinus]